MRGERWDYEIRQTDNWRQNVLEERKVAGNRREQRLRGRGVRLKDIWRRIPAIKKN